MPAERNCKDCYRYHNNVCKCPVRDDECKTVICRNASFNRSVNPLKDHGYDGKCTKCGSESDEHAYMGQTSDETHVWLCPMCEEKFRIECLKT